MIIKNVYNVFQIQAEHLVFYSALKKEHIKLISSNHYQFVSNELGSLFVSISEDGDGRAPVGEVTMIASLFTETKDWFNLNKNKYLKEKKEYLKTNIFCFRKSI